MLGRPQQLDMDNSPTTSFEDEIHGNEMTRWHADTSFLKTSRALATHFTMVNRNTINVALCAQAESFLASDYQILVLRPRIPGNLISSLQVGHVQSGVIKELSCDVIWGMPAGQLGSINVIQTQPRIDNIYAWNKLVTAHQA